MPISKQVLVLLLVASTTVAHAAELKKEASIAFDHYAAMAEQRMSRDIAQGKFLYLDILPPALRDKDYAAANNGEVVMIDLQPGQDAPEAVIHDWVGTVFVPGVTLAQTKAFLQDYNVHAKYYRPDMTQSRLLARQGDDFKIFFRLYHSKFTVTAYIDVLMDVQFTQPDAHHLYNRGHSTKVAEVENAGKRNEHELPAGNDRGLLWRLNSYWWAEQRDGGVYVSSEAISLTKKAMWPVAPFIRSAARESLQNLLRSVQNAVPQYARQ